MRRHSLSDTLTSASENGSISEVSEKGTTSDGKNDDLLEQRTLSNSAFVVICLLAILGSFSLFGIMIYLFRGGGKPNNLATDGNEVTVDSNDGRCGPENFMLRDGVCDEATNTEECFFDGGDCCTENTAVWNCKRCECMLDVDKQKLLEDLQVEQVIKADLLNVRMMFKELEPLKTVQNTGQEDVCSKMCLELDKCSAWTYDFSLKTCQCLAFQEPFCRQDLTIFSPIKETDLRMNETSVLFNIKMAQAPMLENCTERVLIAGGRVAKKQQETSGPPSNEVIDLDDPKNKCRYLVGDSNALNNFGMVGGLIGPHAIPLLCGGLDVPVVKGSGHQMVNLKCHKAGQDDASKVLSLVAVQSFFSSSIVFNLVGDILFVTGGSLSEDRGEPTAVTQYVKLNQVAELGPEMPIPLSHHCLIKINESMALLTGGFTSNRLVSGSSFYYQISGPMSNTWTVAPSLKLPRHSHSCGVLIGAEDVSIMVVAGGDTDSNDVSTEFLAFPLDKDSSDIAWASGPDIPLKLEGTSMVSTSSRDRLILMGGIKQNGQQSSAMIQLSCWLFANIDAIPFENSCTWTVIEQKLTLSRSGFVAIIIPNHLTHCESTENGLLQHELTTSDPDPDEGMDLCIGGNDCCSLEEHGATCTLGEGSCSEDHDCERDLICGWRNCDIGNLEHEFDVDDNCCGEIGPRPPDTPSCNGGKDCCSVRQHFFQCGEGEGDCDHDKDCLDGLWCAHAACPWDIDIDQPITRHDCCQSSAYKCKGSDSCCADKHDSGLQCGQQEGQCDSDDQCSSNLLCLADHCGQSPDKLYACCDNPACLGQDDCCNFELHQYRCKDGEGPCNSDNDCLGQMICGQDNCDLSQGDFKSGDNCCAYIGDTDNYCGLKMQLANLQCGLEEGDCLDDSECDQGLVCRACDLKDLGYNGNGSQCCQKEAIPFNDCLQDCCNYEVNLYRCQEGEGDCLVDNDCKDDLVCRYCNPWDLGYLFGGSCCNRKLKECQDEQVCCQQEVGGQCQYGEGDCDYHEDCEGNLVCGIDNCHGKWGNFSSTSDCCVETDYYVCSDFDSCCLEKTQRGVTKCGNLEGHCEHDNQCQDGLVCGSNNCGQPYGNQHNCCVHLSDCSMLLHTRGTKCGLGQGDCGFPGTSHNCEDGLTCGIDNCNTSSNPWLTKEDDCCANASIIICNEDENCCQKKLQHGIPCSLGEGDCDYTFECMEGSFCGYNNCDLTKPWHTAHDDCCASVVPDKQCSPPVDDCCKDKTDGQKCGLNEGFCQSTHQCEDGLVCGFDTCEHFHSCCVNGTKYRCNSGYGCCRRKADGGFKCGLGEGDCDNDDECEDGLSCRENNCDHFTASPFDDCCVVWPPCEENYFGDYECDGINNNAFCEYDGGDCCLGLDENCWECHGDQCKCHETGYPMCAGTCPSGADGYCDWFNNNHGCNFDDGDCCLTEADCTFCHSDECSCHETGLSNCIGEFDPCPVHHHSWIGDEYCDDETNNVECAYDGGDCCLEYVDEYYCYVCDCIVEKE